MDWLNLTAEIHSLTGAELDEAVISRIETVRDLLRETIPAAGLSGTVADPLERLRRPKELLDEEQRRWLEPSGSFVRALGYFLLALNRTLLRSLFRLRVRRLDRLPRKGPCILVANHVSYLDPLALGAALPSDELNRTYWGGWTGIMFKNALMRLVSRAVRVIPVRAEGSPLSSIAFGVAALEDGYNVVWFPEGGRSFEGKLGRFRPGIGLLSSAKPVLLVPVWIDGTYQSLPPGKWLPRLHKIAVTFGKPVHPAELQPIRKDETSYQAIADALRERVAELEASSRESGRD